MAHNSFLPDVTYLKDPYIKEITKGKFRDFTYFTVGEHDQLYPFALGYIPEHLDLSDDETSTDDTSNLWSFRAQYLGGNQLGMFYDPMYGLQTPPQGEEIDESNIVEREKKTNRNFTGFTAGYGLFKLKHEDATIYVLHKSVGDPVGTMNGVAVHNLLVFFVKGRNNTKPLSSLMELIASLHQVERPPNDIIEVYRYNLEFMGWDRFYNARTRPEGSVILPHETKKKILDDVRDFIDKDTKRWYYEKGIPYKRSYLFYGVPGSGKTSIISVLAGKYKRPICYISPTDPKMTDGILKKAVQDAPQRGILIFEDVDGLFSKDRKSNVQNYLTFSGLLNALDGVGSGLGQIFILTTNYRDRLDSALIRNGRVDLQVEFKHVNQEQAVEMFGLFYAEADEKARRDFATKVFELSKTISAEPCISAAMLQNFFITHRRCTYEEAIDRVEDLIEEVKNAIEDDARREVERKQKEEEEKKQKKDELSHNGGPLGVNADLLSMMNQIHQQSVQMNHSFEEEDLLEQ